YAATGLARAFASPMQLAPSTQPHSDHGEPPPLCDEFLDCSRMVGKQKPGPASRFGDLNFPLARNPGAISGQRFANTLVLAEAPQISAAVNSSLDPPILVPGQPSIC